MTARELVLKNIKNNGLLIGKSRGCVGTEIYREEAVVIDIWQFGIKDNNRREAAMKKIRESTETLAVLKITLKSGREFDFTNRAKDSLLRFDAKKIAEREFKDVESVQIISLPKLLGHLSIGKYRTSEESQRELIRDIVALEGKIISDNEIFDSSWDEPDNAEHLSDNKNDDYSPAHGDGWCQSRDDSRYVDGRIYSSNDTVMEDFWSFSMEDNTYLDEIDPDDKICVYHRKGKDWYIAYSLNQEEYYFDFINEKGEVEEGEAWVFSYEEDSELLDEVTDVVEGWKKDCEVKSELMNRLNIGDIYGGSTDVFDSTPIYCEKIMDQNYEDRYELRNEIEDFLKYDGDAQQDVLQAFEGFLKDNMKDGKLFGKYTHLQKVEELAKRDGRELIYTKIGDFTEDMAYAIKYKDQEFHFSLVELYENSPLNLYRTASAGLSIRLNEIYSGKILIKSAKSVFVGLEDSHRSGNCHTGTSHFCKLHGIDTQKIGGIRGDYLLEMDFSDFTKRAVLAALKERGVAA